MENTVLDTNENNQTLSYNGHSLTLTKIAPTEFRIDQSNVGELRPGNSINLRDFRDNIIELNDGTKFTIK